MPILVHFIPFSVDHRRRFLDHDRAKRIFLGWFKEVFEQFQAMLIE